MQGYDIHGSDARHSQLNLDSQKMKLQQNTTIVVNVMHTDLLLLALFAATDCNTILLAAVPSDGIVLENCFWLHNMG